MTDDDPKTMWGVIAIPVKWLFGREGTTIILALVIVGAAYILVISWKPVLNEIQSGFIEQAGENAKVVKTLHEENTKVVENLQNKHEIIVTKLQDAHGKELERQLQNSSASRKEEREELIKHNQEMAKEFTKTLEIIQEKK